MDRDSAILGLSTESPVPISADHRSMCKFASQDEQKYKPVWKAVEKLVELVAGEERKKQHLRV